MVVFVCWKLLSIMFVLVLVMLLLVLRWLSSLSLLVRFVVFFWVRLLLVWMLRMVLLLLMVGLRLVKFR